MNKIKEILTKLTTGKNKKFYYIGLGIIAILIVFLSLNKQATYNRTNKTTDNDNQVGGEYVGVKPDEGLRFSSFTTNIINYYDADYGNISITINGQLFYRENHDKSYYMSHPYDKKVVANQIKTFIEDAINQLISENDNLKYNELRNIINSETITAKIKDQVSNLDFTFEKVDIYTFSLTQESITKIKEVEISKRPQFSTTTPDESNTEEIIEDIT